MLLDVNECEEGRQVCGYGAECINRPGSHDCVCPRGYTGDPYNGVCSPNRVKCVNDGDCSPNEKCVQPGECVCPPPFFTDQVDGNKCKSMYRIHQYNNCNLKNKLFSSLHLHEPKSKYCHCHLLYIFLVLKGQNVHMVLLFYYNNYFDMEVQFV